MDWTAQDAASWAQLFPLSDQEMVALERSWPAAAPPSPRGLRALLTAAGVGNDFLKRAMGDEWGRIVGEGLSPHTVLGLQSSLLHRPNAHAHTYTHGFPRSLSDSSIVVPDFGSLSSAMVSPRRSPVLAAYPAIINEHAAPSDARPEADTNLATSADPTPDVDVDVDVDVDPYVSSDPYPMLAPAALASRDPVRASVATQTTHAALDDAQTILALQQTVRALAQTYADAVLASHSPGGARATLVDLETVLARYLPRRSPSPPPFPAQPHVQPTASPAQARATPILAATPASIVAEDIVARQLRQLTARYQAVRAQAPQPQPPASAVQRLKAAVRAAAAETTDPDPDPASTGRVRPNTVLLPVSPARPTRSPSPRSSGGGGGRSPLRPSSASSRSSGSASRRAPAKAPGPPVGYDFDVRQLLRSLAPPR